jgi:hypothetical protein
MTDSSSFANSLTEPLRQPLWWAALASVSLHGVLGVSAPTISNLIYGDPNSKNRPGSVGVIELTPAEVGRLPQTIPAKPSNNSPFSFAPLPLPRTNLTPPLPPAPPAIDLPALPPGMPPPGFFSPGPLPAPNFNTPLPPTPQAAIPKSPPPKPPAVILQQPPNLIVPPLPSDFDRNIPPPPSLTPQFQPPANPGSLDEGEALERLRNAQGRLPLFPDGAPVFTPEFPIGPRSSESGDRVPRLTQKDPNKRGQFPETPEEIARRQQFEAQQRRLQPGSGLPANREEQLAATEKYIALFENFKRAYPNLEMTGPTPVNVPYPTEACSQKLEGVAVFGAVVNPQGALVALPADGAIASTGSAILDDAARRTLIDPATRFSPSSTHRLYQVAIEFKYDTKICGGTPPTRSPAPTQAQPLGPASPAPAPVQEPPTNQRPSPPPAQVKPNFEKEAKPAPVQRPSPLPKPSPAQQTSPQPQPAPVQRATPAPEPSPAPAAEPSPAIEPSPAPVAEPSPAIEESPAPVAEPSPTPEASPSAAPEQTPASEVAPSPAPEQTPAPAPSGAS